MILDAAAAWDWFRGVGRRPRATIDFETRSAAQLKNGAWLYAKHPTTRVLCLAYQLPGQEPRIWRAPVGPFPGDPISDLAKLFAWIRSGGLVEAHNVMFERAIWEHVFSKARNPDESGSRGVGAPVPKDTQWRCSAAKCAAFAFPRSLGGAGAAIFAREQKDPRGDKLLQRLSKPRKWRKGDPVLGDAGYEEGKPLWHDYDATEFQGLYDYCLQDVRSEHCLSDMLPDLSDFEQKVWLADFRANWRGIRVDLDLVHAAISLDHKAKRKLNEELEALTGIDAASKRAQLVAWLEKQGIELPDTTAPTVDWFMDQPSFKAAKESHATWPRVLEIMRVGNKTSVTKFKRILECTDPDDGRVRELVMYHGAATGRWSGKGIQVQNFAKGNLAELLGVKQVDFEQAIRDVKTRDLEWCSAIYGDVLALLSAVCRGALIPSEGRKMWTADYAAIEARVVLWLADAKGALEVFLRGEDIYCDMASGIYGRTITKADKDERQFGKQAILGLGFGMGFITFLLTLRKYKISFTDEQVSTILGPKLGKYLGAMTERMTPTQPRENATDEEIKRYKEKRRQAAIDRRRLTEARENPDAILMELSLCKYVVDVYRARYPEVVAMWKAQEAASCKAVLDYERMSKIAGFPVAYGPLIEAGKVTWQVVADYLLCTLPSGRRIVYAFPSIKWQMTPWGERKPSLRFMGVQKKGAKKWAPMGTYGGSEVENETQGTARDMMAYAMVAAEASDIYWPLTTVHDELVAEADEGTGDSVSFENLMVGLPPCYEGCPVAAEGSDALERYQK